MNVVDLAPLLEEGEDSNGPCTVLEGTHVTAELITLAAHTAWQAPTSTIMERTLLGLEGHATASVDGTRQTISSGFLLHVPQGGSLSIHNEEKGSYRALLTTAQLPEPVEAPENSE
jgi:quercetin dioxygenase-like cupin family protein